MILFFSLLNIKKHLSLVCLLCLSHILLGRYCQKNGSKVGFWKKDINADAHIGGEGVSIEGGSYDTENSQVYSLKEKGSM